MLKEMKSSMMIPKKSGPRGKSPSRVMSSVGKKNTVLQSHGDMTSLRQGNCLAIPHGHRRQRAIQHASLLKLILEAAQVPHLRRLKQDHKECSSYSVLQTRKTCSRSRGDHCQTLAPHMSQGKRILVRASAELRERIQWSSVVSRRFAGSRIQDESVTLKVFDDRENTGRKSGPN